MKRSSRTVRQSRRVAATYISVAATLAGAALMPVPARGDIIYVTNYNGGTVGEYTDTGVTVNSSLISGLINPTGIAISGSDLFVANYNGGTFLNGTIGEYDTSGATVNPSLISGLSGPQGLTVSGSNLFVTNRSTGFIG